MSRRHEEPRDEKGVQNALHPEESVSKWSDTSTIAYLGTASRYSTKSAYGGLGHESSQPNNRKRPKHAIHCALTSITAVGVFEG